MSKSKDPPPAEPIPQSTVIALQAWKDKNKISNANWESKLNEAVTVNPGDSIFVKASFIDTRGTASGNIDLAVDTEISLEYYFYWIHTFNACDASGLIQSPVTPDASNNLNQQVLVGAPVQYLINNTIKDNIPGYYTYTGTNADGKYAATNLNDADGLPYLVYQSTNEYPVPAVIGEQQDALNIVSNNSYLVSVVGLTTNWAYAGVVGANYNKLPAGWDFNTSYFTATNNPWFNLPTSAFIPAALAAPLPYITYIITTVGDTDWIAIDPGLASNVINATSMVNGGRYAIASLGTFDFTYWGAASNTVGDVFTAHIPPVLPVVFPQTITNATFLANVGNWFQANGGPTFGADPTDALNVVINMDPNDGTLSLASISGGGPWLSLTNGVIAGAWVIPGSYFGFSAGTPSATAEVSISNFTTATTGLSVTNLHVGTTYKVLTTGSKDGSDPQFTWNMVGNFPTAQSTALSPDVYFQIIAPLTGVNFTSTQDGGVVSEIFLCQEGNILSQVIQIDVSTFPNIADCTLTDQTGFDYMPELVSNYEAGVNLEVQYTNNIGVWYYFVYEGGDIYSVLGTGPHEGSPFSDQAVPAQILTLTIPPKTIGPLSQTQFQSGWNPNPSVNGGFDYGNVWSMTALNPPPQPQQLIVFNGVGEIFVATGFYTGVGTTATVEGYSITGATLIGTGYVYGQVEASVIEPGTVVHAINPDPGLPTDNGGRANVDAYQAGSSIPFQYDGYVYDYTPATVKFDTRPVKKKWSMTIPRGSYNPNYLAELISRNMSKQKIKRVNNVKGGPFSKQAAQSTLTVPTDSIYNNIPAAPVWADPNSGGANTFYDSKNPAAYGYPPAPNYNLPPDNADDMPFLFCPAMSSTILNSNSDANPTGSDGNFIWAEIPHPNANGLNNLPQPTYYINLVPLCNDVKSVSPTVEYIGVPQFNGHYSILPFYTQNSLTNNGETNLGNSGVFPVVFGATQTSLLYNNENNGLFSFNYLHSPIYAALSSASTDLAEVTAHMYTTQKVSTNMTGTNYFTTLIDKKSGILLNKMEPASFWEQLGFDIPALTVDFDKEPREGYEQGFQITFNEFQAKTTGGFCGSSNIFNPLFKTANSADQPCVPDTELIYLTATPPSENNSYPVIKAYNTTPLVIDAEYLIIAHGGVYTNEQGQTAELFDWSSIGGPNTGNNPNGTIFTATSTGFDPAHPPNGAYAWWDPPNPPLVKQQATILITTTQMQNTYFQVENTNVLNAGTIPTVRDSTGHYLVEITGYNSNYIDGDSKYEIKALVSAYWVSPGSFVSVPFADSYNFFGTGSPITLSGLKVRILDPFTMQTAVIGPNSSIYLQVNKMLTEQAVAQIPN